MIESEWLIPRNCPLNIAHRGASAAAPQNTLAAFRGAMELGADGVELDVHLSADGVPVVMHNFHVDETTDGAGRIADKTLAELKELDAGSKFSPQYAGERIPALAEVFEVLEGKLLVNVELKSLGGPGSAPLVVAALEVIRRHDMDKHVLFSSFDPFALRTAKRLAPDIPAGLLYAPDLPIVLRRAWLASLFPHEARNPHFSMVTERTMRWYRAHKLRVNTWTVDDPTEMKRLIALGVDSIITDVPDVLDAMLR